MSHAVFAGFFGHANSIKNIIPLLKRIYKIMIVKNTGTFPKYCIRFWWNWRSKKESCGRSTREVVGIYIDIYKFLRMSKMRNQFNCQLSLIDLNSELSFFLVDIYIYIYI